MSTWMTIADESVEQKDACTDLTPKTIVEYILEEALLSAFVILDKGCSRIGDFNITDDFRSQYDQLSCQKDFEQVEQSPEAKQDSNLNSGESTDRPASWLTARGNLESIIDSLVKNEEKIKPSGECTIITEEILADNELQIQNGQIHLETNRSEKIIPEPERKEFLEKEDVIKDEKIEIEYYNEGKLNKIYVPLNPSCSSNAVALEQTEKEKIDEEPNEKEEEEDNERSFKPFTAEEVRQSSLQGWENGVSSFVGKWDGDVLAEQEEVARLMDRLSSVQMFPDNFSDPNRPRACAFGEEDVRKMIKEIEEISLTQSHGNVKDFDVAFLPDGQGDADLESKSFTKSKEFLEKAQKAHKLQESDSKSIDEAQKDPQDPPPSSDKSNTDVKLPTDNIKGEQHLQYKVIEEESLVKSRLYDETAIKEKPSSDQIQDQTTFSIDLPPENNTSDSGTLSKEESSQNISEVFLTDSIHLKGFQSQRNLCNEYLPESGSLSGNIGSLSGSKQEELTVKTSKSAWEPDSSAVQEKRSELLKTSSTHEKETISDVNVMSEQGTSSLEKPSGLTLETKSCLNVDSVPKEIPSTVSFVKTEEKTESNEADDFLQESDVKPEKEEEEGTVKERESEEMKVDLNRSEGMECLEDTVVDLVNVEIEEKKVLSEDTISIYPQNSTSAHPSMKSLDPSEELPNFGAEPNPSASSSQTHTIKSYDSSENGVSEPSEPGTKKFKLDSPKMYLGTTYQPAGSAPNEFTLTESEEVFIDYAESVIQIIEPSMDSAEEDNSKISFSLMSETPEQKQPQDEQETKSDYSFEENTSREIEIPTKKVYSGMTTIGPMKNIDYDPKDLTAPEIDYGKMTRITSSRQLAKDMSLLSAEVTTTMSVKIIEEDDSDESISLNTEDDRLNRTSLVNRDIASLTKVQKVREVMSYQPKPEEDFDDEEVLPRPRLDLKDVESMTDARYKVPDVSIPLLSFEIGDGSLDSGKELIESMGLVISGLTNPAYFVDDDNESASTLTDSPAPENDIQVVKPSSSKFLESKSSKLVTKDPEIKEEEKAESVAPPLPPTPTPTPTATSEEIITIKESQHEGTSTPTKYSTLGSVFRKASNKLIRKDEELFTRSSKSLPRDTSKISTTDSIRSILDDCQSSASNMLKKSRSFLKNTQSIFKSISQSRVIPDRTSGHSVDKKKVSPSESDVSTIEKKLSGLLKREDFTKAKNLLKNKIEKTFKLDSESSTTREREITPERKKNLQVVVRNEQSLRVDKMENFRKLLPKSPLVYKSQFVRSQMNFQEDKPETQEPGGETTAEEQKSETVLNVSVAQESNEVPERPETLGDERPEPLGDEIPETFDDMRPETLSNERPEPIGDEIPETLEVKTETEEQATFEEVCLQEKLQWVNSREEFHSRTNLESEPPQPRYIVMETIQGLPTSDLESPSSEKENFNLENSENIQAEKAGNDFKKIEASNSIQIITDGGHDIVPHSFPEGEDDKMPMKTPSERKIKTKKKKFTARFRSFWCSAFGRVKTSPKKGDLS